MTKSFHRELNAHRTNRPSLFRRIALPLLAGALGLPGVLLHAQTISTWNGGAGAWGTGTNWTPTGVPNSNLYDVFIDGGNVSASNVTLGNDLTVGRITIDAGDSLALNLNTYLTIQGGGFAGSGAVVVNGSMALNSASLLRFGETGSQTFTLSGSGTLDLAAGSITSIVSGNTLQNSLAIVGSGSIGGNLLNIVHSGTITAQGAAGISLQPLATFTNAGTITAAAGSKVEFNSGIYTNTGHTMVATGVGAQLHFAPGTTTVTGGTLRGVSGGEVYLHSDNVVLDGSGSEAVTLEGATRMAVNYYPIFKGTITNNGTITGENTSRFMVGTASGQTVILNGSGSLVLNAASISSSFTGNVLDSSIPISGSGQIGQNIANIINRSTITATGAMTLDPTTTFTNLGTVTASSAVIEVQDGTYINTGHVMAATGAGAQLHITGFTTVTGGTLRGESGGEVYLHSDNVVLDGSGSEAVTLEGATRMAVNYWATFKGTIVNNGTMSAESTSRFNVGTGNGQTTTIRSSNTAGVLVLNNALIYSNYTGTTLLNGDGHTIRGSGTIGFGALDIRNVGTFGGGAGILSLSPASTFINDIYFGSPGEVLASGGGNVNVTSGAVTNNGRFKADTSGTLSLTGSATLTNFSGGTLTGGSYEVIGGGVMDLGIGSITTNAARVKLDGASASFAPINSLATNAAAGEFEITNGRNFSTAGAFLNSGVLVVRNASTFTATASFSNPGLIEVHPGGTLLATAAPLPQYTTGTLTAGDFRVSGTFKFSGGDIVRIGGALSLTGAAAQVQKDDGSSAILAVEEVQSGGSFLLQDRTFTTTANIFTNDGRVYVVSSTLNVPTTYSQHTGATTYLDNGTITAGVFNVFDGTLFGQGTLQAGLSTVVGGSIHPNGGPFTGGGTIHVVGDLALGTDAIYEFSLGTYLDNGNGVAGVDWDLVSATGRIRNSSVVDFTIGWGLDPTTGNTFWDSNHDWKVMVSETADIAPTFNLTNATFAAGSFSLEKNTEGAATVLTLNYTSTVPEPTGAALLVCGALSLLCARRRTRA